MVRVRIVMIIILLILAACSQLPTKTVQDFSLLFKWNTGSLPPQYTYSYTIILGPGAQGKLEYQPGYDADNSLRWIADFSVSEKQIHDLYQYLDSKDMFRSKWEKGEQMEGSPGTSLMLKANGKQYNIPSIDILASSEYALVDAAIEAIRVLVPQTIWIETDARQQEFITNYEK